MDVNRAGLDVSDTGSSVMKVSHKSKKINRRNIDNSSDEENDDESLESRSVAGGVKSDVEHARSFLWALAQSDVQLPTFHCR